MTSTGQITVRMPATGVNLEAAKVEEAAVFVEAVIGAADGSTGGENVDDGCDIWLGCVVGICP